jgi:ABC-type spermidine/putrescine transport system permease subunit II
MSGRSHSWLGRIVGWKCLALVLAAMYLPVAMTFVYSFNASRVGTVWTGFSTRGYSELWRERGLWEGLEASLIIGAVARGRKK